MSNWRVPFIDLPREYHDLNLDILSSEYLNLLLRGRFILGPEVEKFEHSMADYLGVDSVVGVNSGTDALSLSLIAADVGPGKDVITVGHTFAATLAAIRGVGANPILVDVEEDSFNMDPKLLEEAVTENTWAIMPVHLNGRSCNMDAIQEVATRFSLEIIEDACQGLGSTFKNRQAGTWGFGCFSTHPLKILSATGDGGYISIHKDFRDKVPLLRILRNHGTFDKVNYLKVGFNSRLDELQASILNSKMPHLDYYIEMRRGVASTYHEGLRDIEQVKVPFCPTDIGLHFDSYNAYVIRVKDRDELREHLTSKGIETLVNWPIPNHFQEPFGLQHYKGRLPVTEKLANEVLNLPIFPQMEAGQVEYVIECIKDYYFG